MPCGHFCRLPFDVRVILKLSSIAKCIRLGVLMSQDHESSLAGTKIIRGILKTCIWFRVVVVVVGILQSRETMVCALLGQSFC